MILVTGATGFLGSHFIRRMDPTKNEIRCFVRETSNYESLDNNFQLAFGSFEDVASYRKALDGVDTLVNIASLGFGHAPIIVDEAEKAGVKRAVFISTTALFTTLEAKTKSVRLAGEQKIKESNLDYTILRPTMIYGTECDRNMARLVNFIHRYPVVPIAGDGNSLQQPIHVDDLAEAIIATLKNDITVRKEYNLSGKQPLTYNQVIDETASVIGKKIYKLHVPVNMVLPIVEMYNKIVSRPIIRTEQVLRLNENKAFDHLEASKDFGFNPRSFEVGISQEVEIMKLLKMI
jgi:nucleoside-diphosphate-sugar epimerase